MAVALVAVADARSTLEVENLPEAASALDEMNDNDTVQFTKSKNDISHMHMVPPPRQRARSN